MADQYDVIAIGNAIVDVLAAHPDAFLQANGIPKGSMRLISAAEAAELYGKMGPGREVSGGSAANSCAGIAALGGRAAFVGRVSNDQLGKVFAHDIRAAGVDFRTPPAESGPPTGQCLIIVSPDAQRTMSTYLGSCQEVDEPDVDEAMVRAAKVTYFEGYLWDPPRAKEAIRLAAAEAHAAGREVAMTLSDPFCVDRYRGEFLELMRSGTVDIVFANEHELKSLYQAADFADALAALQPLAEAGLLQVDAQGITVMPKGRLLVRIIAMAFDRYLQADRQKAPEGRQRYSRVI